MNAIFKSVSFLIIAKAKGGEKMSQLKGGGDRPWWIRHRRTDDEALSVNGLSLFPAKKMLISKVAQKKIFIDFRKSPGIREKTNLNATIFHQRSRTCRMFKREKRR